ncbi:MAG: hypothetical protein IPN83_04520 [Holophagales bacterium]|nr:hypothetical protein [Holophagales bacterium]
MHRGPVLLSLAGFGLCVALTPAARALDVPLTVTAREAAPRPGTIVTSGVPFAKGALGSPALVRLLQGASEVPLQARRTASWPDGSVRWLLLDFPVDLPAAPASIALTLRTGAAPAPVSGIIVDDQPGTLTVRTGAATIAFQKTDFVLRALPFEVGSDGTTYRAVPEQWTIEEPGPVKAVIRVEGRFASESGSSLGSSLVRFRARLTFWRNDTTVRAAVTFQNRGPFCWEAGGCTRAPDVVLDSARLGTSLLPAGGRFVFGPGVEKTWDVSVAGSGTAALLDTRYRADGTLAEGSVPPAPLAVAPPAYVVSTAAWGPMALPVTGLPADRQEDFDRFEKLHRALVVPADVENPPGLSGTTIWSHLSRDLASWNDYGDLRWDGNGCGTLSGNHYDWSFGMALHFLRTGRLEFADAARLFARHEEDFDVYHTAADGNAFSFQKNWEDRPSHDTPDNCFGGGRPTHTWSQGYALHWLLTGDPRGKDAFDEIQEGVRLYVYESFSGEGHVSTSEIRTQGWLTDNLVARYRIEPDALLRTSSYGDKSIPHAIQDVLEDVFAREAAAGSQGFVINGETWEADYPHGRAPLQHLYFLEPALSAYQEVFKGRDASTAGRLLGLMSRMVGWLSSVGYGGDTNVAGLYRPRQIPFLFDSRQPVDGQGQGQILYGLMAANAAAFVAGETGRPELLDQARLWFRDAVRYSLAIGGDSYGEPGTRSATSYASSIFVGTESKVHGWINRFGQRLLAAERGVTLFVPVVLDLSGLNGSRYTTELTVTNRGAGEARATFAYTAFAGGGSGSTTTPLALPPGRQVVLPDALAFLASHGVPVPGEGSRGGTLRVRIDGLASPGDASVLARTTTPAPSEAPLGRAGLAYAAVPDALLPAGPVRICGLRQTAADRSAVALQNAGTDGDVTLRVSLFGSGATAPAATFEATLAPGGFTQPTLPDLGATGATFLARVERIGGSAPWFAYGVVNDNETNDGSFVPPLPDTAAGPVVLPVAVEAGGFTTEVVFTELSGTRQTLHLTYAAAAVDGGATRLDIDLEPHEQRVVPALVAWLRELRAPGVGAPGPAFAGPLLVDAPGALAVTARTLAADPLGRGRYGLAYPAPPAAALPSSAVFLDGLRQGDATRTNLALVNPGAASAGYRVELFSGATGAKVAETTETLAPLGFLQIGRVLSTLAPGVADGYARVTPLSGASFAAYAVLNDGENPGERTGDGAFVAASR